MSSVILVVRIYQLYLQTVVIAAEPGAQYSMQVRPGAYAVLYMSRIEFDSAHVKYGV